MSAIVDRLRAAGSVFAEDEAALLKEAAAAGADLEELVRRRVAGEPLAHVLGWVEFQGLRVAVEPGVFVPRRRTELLVTVALRDLPPGALVVDLCCGCGAVAAAIAGARPDVEVHAADVDPLAVACARRNVARVHEGNLYDALPDGLRGRISVITCNAPYVPTDAIAFMPPEARDHEPRLALDGGADGLDVHRRVAALAPSWLAPGGLLLVETSEPQASRTAAAMKAAGLGTTTLRDADLDATVVIGVRHERRLD